MCIRDSSDTPVALDAWVASVARCSSPQLRDVIRLAWMPNACATGAARCATQTANTNGKPVHDFQASPRSYANGYDGRPETRVESMTWGLSLIHISEPTRLLSISYAVFCLK